MGWRWHSTTIFPPQMNPYIPFTILSKILYLDIIKNQRNIHKKRSYKKHAKKHHKKTHKKQ
jgi:hypothetical protein